MRTISAFVLLVPFVATLAGVACSSSSSGSSDLFDASSDVTTQEDSSGGTDTGGGHDSSVSDTSSGDSFVPFDSGPLHDAQAACAVTLVDGGDAAMVDGEAGASNVEVESNDDAGSANPLVLNGPECGSISPATDVDFFKFTLPANATKMQVSFDGNVSLTFTVGSDAPVVVTPQSFPTVGFHPGAEYTVEVKSFDGNAQAYAITITES